MRATPNFASLFLLLLATIAGGCWAQCGDFPFPDPLPEFNIREFTSTWYKQEAFELQANHSLESQSCNRHYYFIGGFDPVPWDENSFSDGVQNFHFLWRIYYGERLGDWDLNRVDSVETDAIHVVNVDTDYESYAIQFLCVVPFENPRNISRMLILTREQFPSEELISELESKVETYGFAREHGVRTNQTNCS